MPRKKQCMIHIRLTEELHHKLSIQVAKERTNFQTYIHAIIERELNKKDREEKK